MPGLDVFAVLAILMIMVDIPMSRRDAGEFMWWAETLAMATPFQPANAACRNRGRVSAYSQARREAEYGLGLGLRNADRV